MKKLVKSTLFQKLQQALLKAKSKEEIKLITNNIKKWI